MADALSSADIARVGLRLSGGTPPTAAPKPAPVTVGPSALKVKGPAVQPAAADTAKPLTWDEVLAHPDMKNLSGEQLEAARRQYFADVVAPQVPADQVNGAWESFDADTSPSIMAQVKRGASRLLSLGKQAEVKPATTASAMQAPAEIPAGDAPNAVQPAAPSQPPVPPVPNQPPVADQPAAASAPPSQHPQVGPDGHMQIASVSPDLQASREAERMKILQGELEADPTNEALKREIAIEQAKQPAADLRAPEVEVNSKSYEKMTPEERAAFDAEHPELADNGAPLRTPVVAPDTDKLIAAYSIHNNVSHDIAASEIAGIQAAAKARIDKGEDPAAVQQWASERYATPMGSVRTSTGRTINDYLLGLASGTATLLATPGGLANTLTFGGYDAVLKSIFGKSGTQMATDIDGYLSGQMSDQTLSEKYGLSGTTGGVNVVTKLLQNPKLLAQVGVESAPSTLGLLGITRGAIVKAYSVAEKAALDAGRSQASAASLAREAATNAGEKANIVANGLMGAGQNALQTKQQVMAMPEPDLENSPIYNWLRKYVNAETAREVTANLAAEPSAVIAGFGDALATKFSGAGKSEAQIMTGKSVRDKILAFRAAPTPEAIGSLVRPMVNEAKEEFVQSGPSEQGGQNVGIKLAANPDQPLGDQVMEQGALGATLAVGQTAGMHVAGAAVKPLGKGEKVAEPARVEPTMGAEPEVKGKEATVASMPANPAGPNEPVIHPPTITAGGAAADKGQLFHDADEPVLKTVPEVKAVTEPTEAKPVVATTPEPVAEKQASEPLKTPEIVKQEAVAPLPGKIDDRLANHEVRAELERMAKNAGWAEVGGRITRTPGENGEEIVGRTKWVPKEEWWQGRPGALNVEQTREAVRKALAGEKLTKNQTKAITGMVEWADQSLKGAKPESVSDEVFQPTELQNAGVAALSEQDQPHALEMAEAVDSPDNWSTMSEAQKDSYLDEIFGTDSRAASSPQTGASATRPAGESQTEVAPAQTGQEVKVYNSRLPAMGQAAQLTKRSGQQYEAVPHPTDAGKWMVRPVSGEAHAEGIRSDQGQTREGSASGQPDVQQSAVGGGGHIQLTPSGQPDNGQKQRSGNGQAGHPPPLTKERRSDTEKRKAVSEMSQEEMRHALLASEATGIGNRRAYDEAAKKPVQVSIDADSLKWVNDHMGHETGDKLLRLIGQAFADEQADAYHLSGDEFAVQADDHDHAAQIMNGVRERLDKAILEFKVPDGRTITLNGIGVSYGTGKTLGEADQHLQSDKAARELSGARAGRGLAPPRAVEKPAQRVEAGQSHPPAERVTEPAQTPSQEGVSTYAPGKEVERFAGQYGKGLTEFNANRVAKERSTAKPGLDWRVAVAPEFGPDRFVVVGHEHAVDAAAHEAATSPKNDLPAPTEPQIDAGNYKKGHIRIGGLDISVENPEGSRRRPEWPPLKSHYGYLLGTTGKDKEHIDVFVKPGTAEDYSGPVFVIDQKKTGNGHFDEHKVMLGWPDEAAARAGYLENYTKGWDGVRAITPMSLDDFKTWLKEGETTKPVNEAVIEQPPAAKPAKAGAQRNEDVGENLWYNRRNFTGKALAWDQVKDLNDTLKLKEVVKAKVWPKPDYEKLIADGMQPFFARMLKQVYDGIAVAPAAKSDEDLQRYIDVVGKVREAVFAWAKDLDSNRAFAASALAEVSGERTGKIVPLTELLENHDKGFLNAILSRLWPEEMAKNRYSQFSRGSVANEDIKAIGGNRALKALQFTTKDVKNAFEEINEGWPKSQEAWQRQGLHIIDKAAAHIRQGSRTVDGKNVPVYRVMLGKEYNAPYLTGHPTQQEAQADLDALKPFILVDKRGRVVDSFDTTEAAAARARELVKRENKGGDLRGMNIADAERTGPERRAAGEDVSAERLMSEFGFRGVNFGREGWINQTERQAYLNHTYDGLHDFAEILELPPKALSLNGMLGIAFGAQGRGGNAAAHFVPGVNEINLTKTMGAGTLAQEWGHALDHYFAVQAGMAKATDPFLSAATGAVKGEIRPEIRDAFKAVYDAMNRRAMSLGEMKMLEDNAKAKALAQLDRWIDHFRKDVDRTAQDKVATLKSFDELAARLRAGDEGEGYVKVGQMTLPEVVGRLRTLVKEQTKNSSIDVPDNWKGLASNAHSVAYRLAQKEATVTHIPQTTSTTYAQESKSKDADKKGKQYWSTPWEMFARAFETYVADRLADESRQNTFLTDAATRAEQRDRSGQGYASPYPRGEDRKAINAAIDKLVNAIETKETYGGTALFSRGQVAGMGVDDVNASIAPIRSAAKNLPPITVLESVKQAPEALRADIKKNGAEGDVAGAFHDGQVYLFADQLRDPEHAQFVLLHEATHFGLRGLFGPEIDPVLMQMWMTNPDIRKQAGERMAKFGLSRVRAVEEVLADMGGKNVQPTLWQQFVGFVRDWLRRNGFTAKFVKGLNDADITRILQQASAYWKDGKGKNATHLYRDGAFSQNAPMFYSQLTATVAQKMGNAEPVAELKKKVAAWIASGAAKADELQWSGLQDWLDLQTGKVSKEAVLAYLRDNGVKVEDVELGSDSQERVEKAERALVDHLVTYQHFDANGAREYALDAARGNLSTGQLRLMSDSQKPLVDALQKAYAKRASEKPGQQTLVGPNDVTVREDPRGDAWIIGTDGFNETNVGMGTVESRDEAQAYAVRYFNGLIRERNLEAARAGRADATKFSSYQLPGGENYRELLLTLPEKPDRAPLSDSEERRLSELTRLSDAGRLETGEQNAEYLDLNERARRAAMGERFRSAHFDQPNILAHVRFNERADDDGKRVLFLEELQSDWAQKGKREGFAPNDETALQKELTEVRKTLEAGKYGEPAYEAAVRREDQIIRMLESKTPAAPFVGKTEAWVALSLKRMIRYAAANGFDRIAWTSGEQQAARYDLSKQVHAIEVRDAGDGKVRALAYKSKGENDPVIDKTLPRKDLGDLIGKDIAERALKQLDERKAKNADAYAYMTGNDLKIGGEGMRAFYDKIVPNVANDVLKKLGGGKVGQVTLDMRDERAKSADGRANKAVEQPGFDITPALKERALQGMPLFSRNDKGDILKPYTPAELKAREEAAKKAEDEKAKEPPAKKVTADQADLFQTQGSLFSRNGPQNLADRIDAILRGASTREHIYLGETPEVLKRLGMKPLPVGMSESTVQKAIFDHSMLSRELKVLADAMADPVAVVDSESNIAPKGSLVVLTDLVKSDGRPVIVAVHPDGQLVGIKANIVASIYPKDNAKESVARWLRERLRYANNEKRPEWQRLSGVQFPGRLPTRSASGIVLTERDIVKSARTATWGNDPFPKGQDARFSRNSSAEMAARGITPRVNKGIVSRYKGLAQKVIDFTDRLSNPLVDLPGQTDYLKNRQVAMGVIGSGNDVVKEIRTVFADATPEDRRAAFDFFTTEGATAEGIQNEKVRNGVQTIKDAINHVSDQLVDKGIISAEARDEFRDRYLPQLYLRHLLEDNAWKSMGAGKKTSDMGYAKARKLDQFRNAAGEIRLRDKVSGKELSDEEVLKLGPVTDPEFLASVALARPMRDMAILDWLESISKDERWVLPNTTMQWNGKRVSPYFLKTEADRLRRQAAHYEPDAGKRARAYADRMDAAANKALESLPAESEGFTQIPNTGRYGAMRGIWVRTEIYHDLVGNAHFQPNDMNWFQNLFGVGGIGAKATSVWKGTKTYLNPSGQVRNFVTNMTQLQLSGVPFHSLPPLLIRAVGEMKNKGQYLQEFKVNGGEAGTFANEDLGRMQRELLDMEHRAGELSTWGKLHRAAAIVTNAAGDSWQAIEVLGKLMKFMHERERGAGPGEAMIEANKTLFDYSLVQPWIRYARAVPFGIPFATWNAKVLPRLLETALLHPVRYLPYVALYYGAQYALASMLGVGYDDLEKLRKAMPQWLWDKKHAMLMPWKDAKGRWEVMDLSYFMPWTQWAQLGGDVMSGKVSNVLQDIGAFGGPIPNIISAISTQQDPFTHRDIANKGDPPMEQAASWLNYAWTLAAPPFLTDTGVVGHALRAASGTTNKFGDPLDTGTQAALRAIGVNLYALTPEQTRLANAEHLKAEAMQTLTRLKQRSEDRSLSQSKRDDLEKEYRNEIIRRGVKLKTYLDESEIHPQLSTHH